MKLTRPRFTVRRMMVAVATAGLAIGGPMEVARLRRLSEEYGVRADRMRFRASGARSDAGRSQAEWASKVRAIVEYEQESGGRFNAARPLSPERGTRMLPYFEAMRLKYERASRYPWMPVAPDPPKPK